MSIEDDIVAKFDGANCPNLRGKPKLFIIQACQGVEETIGQCVPDGPDDPPSVLPASESAVSSPSPSKQSKKTHEKADILMAYATVPGYKAWRNPDSGTWFIRDFVVTMCKHAHSEHIVEILTKVRQRISERHTGAGHVQMTKDDNRLLKKWYFLPLYSEDSSR